MKTPLSLILLASPLAFSAVYIEDGAGGGRFEQIVVRAQMLRSVHEARGDEDEAQLVFELTDPQRRQVDFFPLTFREDQRGLKVGDMTLAELRQLHALLREVLSEAGYLRVQTIRELEEVLQVLEGGRGSSRIVGNYVAQLYGEPTQEGDWAFKLEGHHLSINAAMSGGVFRGTPLFLGANPAEVRSGSHAGLRVLGPLEDLAWELYGSTNPEQREALILGGYDGKGTIPRGALREVSAPAGLSAAAMSYEQRELLLRLIESFAGHLRADFAAEEMARIRAAGVERLHFSWRGGPVLGQPHSYRIQGPTVFIQLDAIEDRPGAGANHLHCLWSDPERDFGDDLLKQHYEEEH